METTQVPPHRQPLVSIVTPSYNQAEYLEETILSVLNQDYPNIEYIIIDGGSTDGSTDIIRKYADHLTYWISEPDRGQSHAINKGLRRATGEILGWLNSDDMLLPNAVHRMVAFLSDAPEIDMVYGRVTRIDSWGHPARSGKESEVTKREFGLHSVIGECTVTQPGAFWRRRIMDRIGLLNEDLHYVMDYEFWVRIVMAGGTVRRLPGEPIACFRVSEHSKTVSQQDKSGLEKLQVLDQLLADPDLAEKLGLSHRQLRWQERRARALASLKVFQAYGRRHGQGAQAARWLIRAISLYPPLLVTRNRVLLATLRDRLHLALGR